MMQLRSIAISGSVIFSLAVLHPAPAMGDSGVSVVWHSGSASVGARPVFSHRGRHGTRHFRHHGFRSTIRFGGARAFHRRDFRRRHFHHDRFNHHFGHRQEFAFGRPIERSKFCAGRCERKSFHRHSFGRDVAFGRIVRRSKFCAGKCNRSRRLAGSGFHSGKHSKGVHKKRRSYRIGG